MVRAKEQVASMLGRAPPRMLTSSPEADEALWPALMPGDISSLPTDRRQVVVFIPG